MYRSSKFNADKVELNVAAGPANGAPLLLLHGVVRCWQDFLPILPALSTSWQLYGVDHRGHGHSQRATPYRVADYAHDAIELVARGLPEPAILYGHSLGAMVALAVAAELPDRVRALILEDPPCETLGTRIGQTTYPKMYAAWRELIQTPRQVPELAAALADMVLTTPAGIRVRLGDLRDATSLRFTAKCLSQLDPEVLTPLIEGEWFADYDLDAILPRVRCPVLILQADSAAGGMLSDEDDKRLLGGLHDATRIRFPNVGHLIHCQATEATVRHVLGFLASL